MRGNETAVGEEAVLLFFLDPDAKNAIPTSGPGEIHQERGTHVQTQLASARGALVELTVIFGGCCQGLKSQSVYLPAESSVC